MVDIGHRQTDEVLERLEKRLAEEYAQAYKDVEKKVADYFKRFEVKDKQKKVLVDAGELSEKDYQTWRRNQMLSGKRWTDLRDQLAKDLTNTNQIAAGIVRGELNEVFAINANYSEYMIENGMQTNYGFTLYDRNTIENLAANDPDIIPWKPEVDIPADLRWNRQMITSHITQGILQGESIPNLSKRLLKTVNNDKVAAVRTARTAVTSSQNAGRQMVYDRANRMGLKLQKCWMATLDGRTRHEHGAVDGQKVPLDGQFTVGGYKMKFPGDMSAPPHLTWNCRCTTITVEPDDITKGEEPRMTYSEWVESKEGKEAIQKKKDAEKQKREKEKEKRNKQKEKEKAKQEKTNKKGEKNYEKQKNPKQEIYTDEEKAEFSLLQKKYKNKTEVMLFGTPDEMARYDYLLQKDKANSGTFDYYKKFQYQSVSESKLNRWRIEPTTAERDAISSYSRSGYLKMNEHLRFGNYAPESVKKEISELHSFLDKCETQEELYLSRGITKPALDKMTGGDEWRKNPSSLIGSVFTDKGFVSTTPYQGGGFGGDVVMYIKVPKGTKGAYIKEFAASSEEKEFLIQSNQSYVVRQVVEETDKWGEKKYKFFVEVIV